MSNNKTLKNSLLEKELMCDKNYDLFDYINENDIKQIINIFRKYNYKINLNLLDKEHNNPLILAIKKIKPMSYVTLSCVCPFIKINYYDVSDVCSLFLTQKCDINHKNIFGETALLVAIKKFYYLNKNWIDKCNEPLDSLETFHNLIILLIKKNSDVNVIDIFGYTPLMYCVRILSQHNKKYIMNIINFLIEKKCDLNNISKDGKTALILVLENQYIHDLISIKNKILTTNANNDDKNNDDGNNDDVNNGNDITKYNVIKILLDNNIKIDIQNNFINNTECLVSLGDYYYVNQNIDKMKECYVAAIKNGNYDAKIKLFNYFCKRNSHHLITKEECDLIKNIFLKKPSFVILVKSKYFHSEGECSVCLEDTNNIVKLPCHDEHIICVDCVYKLKKNICPFCRVIFPRNITEFYM